MAGLHWLLFPCTQGVHRHLGTLQRGRWDGCTGMVPAEVGKGVTGPKQCPTAGKPKRAGLLRDRQVPWLHELFLTLHGANIHPSPCPLLAPSL